MKEKRQSKIKEIIETRSIETQDELLSELAKEGFHITQATISRDIREMKLTKIASGNGKQKYAMLKNTNAGVEQKYRKVLSAGILSMDYAENLVVIRTVSGMAMAVAAALDNLEMQGLMGSIAGDDTIFVAVRSGELCKEIISNIKKLAAG